MKTLCIDARLWGIAHTGIGRYVKNLISHLPDDRSVRLVLIVSPENFHHPDLRRYSKVIARFHPWSLWSQLEMFILWFKIHPDVLHVPHFSIPVFWPGKIVITIHDLIKHYSRGKNTTTRNIALYWFKYIGYLLIVRIAIARASFIIVPAQYWKDELIRIYRLQPQKITVTYEGVDSGLKIKSESKRFRIPEPFVVYTGNVYPHKNIPVLISAVKMLSGQVNLAIVCARSVFTTRIEKMISESGTNHLITFLGRLTDTQLAGLYSRASAFVFPSLIEGFGLPGLEAMALGLPVIAARASCLPEIYQDAVLYFNPSEPADLANKISMIIRHKALHKSLVTRGLAQSKKYSWAKMSQQTWEIYQKMLH